MGNRKRTTVLFFPNKTDVLSCQRASSIWLKQTMIILTILGTIYSSWITFTRFTVFFRGVVEDTGLEAKAKDTKKILGQGQGQPFRGQTLSRPRTGMLEAKAKDQGHKRKCSPKKKKKRSSQKFFRRSP